MVLGRVIETHKATDIVTYELYQADLVGMGPTRPHSYTIWKNINGKREDIARRIKNKEAVYTIWEDIKKGEQK